MMIRRFAGVDGKLSELRKPTLSIGSRRRSPKGILYAEDYYQDLVSDLDDELLKPIEQEFARYYPSLADASAVQAPSGAGGAALIDWIAAMLVRTRAHAVLCQIVATKIGGLGAFTWAIAPALLNNLARVQWFSELQDLLSRPNMRWKIKTYCTNEIVVLSDFPVCQTIGTEVGGQVTIVPLAKHRVLFGGSAQAVSSWDIPADELNTILSAYADRSIFAADARCLEVVARNLRGEEDWCVAARRPFFGFANRLKECHIPTDVDVSQWWEQFKNSFGESILPWRHP
jgi:hypothetical protein